MLDEEPSLKDWEDFMNELKRRLKEEAEADLKELRLECEKFKESHIKWRGKIHE